MTRKEPNTKERLWMHVLGWLWMLMHWRRKLSPRGFLRNGRHSVISWRRFWASYHCYAGMLPPGTERKGLLRHVYPCLEDAIAQTPIEPIYFYQDAWAFEHIVRERPERHVDVGSHHTFVALLSKVLPVTMVDIRPLALPLASLNFREGNILDLPYEDGSLSSLSSLCVVEHIGLGRYGDPLDPDGTAKAVAELKRVVAPGGNLYLSVPIDDENRTYFNAHRAFSPSYLRAQFAPFKVVETRFIYGNDFCDSEREGFGTACYWLKKPGSAGAAEGSP